MLLHGHAHRGAAGWRGAVSPGVVLAGTLPEPGVAGRHRSSSVAPFARWEGLPHAWRCAQDARTCWGHQGATETALSFGLRQFGSQRIPLYPHTIEDYVSCHTVLYPTLPYPTLPCHPNTHNPQNHSAILRRGQTMPLPCQVPSIGTLRSYMHLIEEW